jgi:hypothetical protein
MEQLVHFPVISHVKAAIQQLVYAKALTTSLHLLVAAA